MADIYLVVTCIAIAYHYWGFEQDMGNMSLRPVGASWVGVWIIMFASLVTLTPRRILAVSFVGACTLPAIAVLSVLTHGVVEGTDPYGFVAEVTIPVFICVGIAFYNSHCAFCMARDATKARRMGSYQLSEKLGEGGMGEVWQAEHSMLARPAAVKLIRAESLGNGIGDSAARTALRRFEREAQATATLTSPHSIVLYDFGIASDGVFYYVMELLNGRDLKTLVQDYGPVPAERAIHFLRAACHSLADAHAVGLVHRDIKPANLFTCRRGLDYDFIKVLDFGLVKNARVPGEAMTQLTSDGITSGTPGFMAPEMVTGEGEVDGRVDIYALGCVGYWLLSGQLVFEGKSPMAILVQHAKEDPPPLSTRTEMDVPAVLEEVLMRCLSKDPNDRPATAQELDQLLAGVANELPPWSSSRAEKWWRTNLPDIRNAPIPARRDQTSAATA